MSYSYPEKHKARCREYYQKNIEREKKRGKKYYSENRERILEQKKEYQQRPEINKKLQEYLKEYRRTHKPKDRTELTKEYYQKNRSQLLAKGKKYREENADQLNARKKELRKLNPERFHKYDRNHREKRKHLLFTRIYFMDNPFPKEIDVDFHHINPVMPFVIPLPKITHQHFNIDLKKHIEYNKEWIKRIFCIDIDGLIFETLKLKVERRKDRYEKGNERM